MPQADFQMDLETARWIAYLKEKIANQCFFTTVAGVSFPNDDGSSRQTAIASCRPRDWLELEHDKGNRYHKRAVKVLTEDRRQIGFLERSWGDAICTGAQGGARFTAVVASIKPSNKRNVLSVQIAVFRLSPQFLAAQPKTLQAAPEVRAVSDTTQEIVEWNCFAFESWLRQTQPRADIMILAKLRGVQHDNAAGSSRQEILLGLEPRAELDVGVNDELTRVQIYTQGGEEIGFLDTGTSSKILKGVIDGKVWKAFAGPIGEVPSGKWKTLSIGLVRVPDGYQSKNLTEAESELLAIAAPAEPELSVVTGAVVQRVEHTFGLPVSAALVATEEGRMVLLDLIRCIRNLSMLRTEPMVASTQPETIVGVEHAKGIVSPLKATVDGKQGLPPVPTQPQVKEVVAQTVPANKPIRYVPPLPNPPTFLPPKRRTPAGTRWEQTTEGKALLLIICAAYLLIRLMISCN